MTKKETFKIIKFRNKYYYDFQIQRLGNGKSPKTNLP